MDKGSFLILFNKYQAGKATKEEQDFLESYYDLFDTEKDIITDLKPEDKEEIKNQMWKSVSDHRNRKPNKKYDLHWIRSRYSGVAAALLFFILTGVFAFYYLNQDQRGIQQVAMAETTGENSILFLAEGSKVILSAGSTLDYPVSFEGMARRVVTLNGEAYFDITHDASRPFVVLSGKLETVVLGTEFNVKAIDGQDDITVTVKKGKVKVLNLEENELLGVITPNQQIVYNSKKIKSVTNNVQAETYLRWMNADLYCDNLTLAEVVQLLEEEFKVRIEIQDPAVQTQRFTTTFSKKDKVENILETICLFNGLTYTYDQAKSVFLLKNKQ